MTPDVLPTTQPSALKHTYEHSTLCRFNLCSGCRYFPSRYSEKRKRCDPERYSRREKKVQAVTDVKKYLYSMTNSRANTLKLVLSSSSMASSAFCIRWSTLLYVTNWVIDHYEMKKRLQTDGLASLTLRCLLPLS